MKLPSSTSRLLAWAGVLVLAWLVYQPGLHGGFLFDDFVNLDALGAMGPIDDPDALLRYLTSGIADPTGRPLSLLTFLIDARDWPADPQPFLRTNILLHLFNASLLGILIRSLGKALGDPHQRCDWVAVVAAGTWLLHPLFVSTTLYVVQREAMLPATFVFASLIAYSSARQRFAASAGREGLLAMASAVLIGTLLATLCKANGLLLPLLALTLESTAFSALPVVPAERQVAYRRMQTAVLLAPSLLLAAFLLRHVADWNADPAYRPWTIGQRALTEPRVLLDYLQLLIVPRSVSTGLYNEDYVVSQDVLHPWATLPSLLAIGALLFIAIRYRQKMPALAAAVLFFLAGHALESTVIPLELYFEHRNYLPAALLGWPLARALLGASFPAWARRACAAALLALLALTTWQRTVVWGDSQALATLWANRNPDSSRAQATAANVDLEQGRPDLAVDRLQRQWLRRPNDLQIALNYINARCAAGGLSPADADRLSLTLQRADIGTLLVRQWLERALYMASSRACPGLDMHRFREWLSAAQRNPRINTPVAREKSFPPLLALVALEDRQPALALHYFNRALKANFQPETAAGQAVSLATHGYYREALQHLDAYEAMKSSAPAPGPGMAKVHQWVLDRQQYWPRELALLRAKIQDELAKNPADSRAN